MTSELGEILAAVRRLGAEGRPAVLATVVHTEGSTYRKPGARMLFPPDGEPLGLVSGGCLEADLAGRAAEVLGSGAPVTVVYDMRSPDDIVWGLGLGCSGEVRVLLERLVVGPPPWLDWLGRRIEQRRAGVLATVFEAAGGLEGELGRRLTLGEDEPAGGDLRDPWLRAEVERAAREALASGRSSLGASAPPGQEAAGTRAQVLVEHVAPPPALLVFGAGQDARPLVSMAADLGWPVTVADHRPALATPARFPEAVEVLAVDHARPGEAAPAIDAATPVVVMTHHFLRDVELLRFLADSPAPYVGLLGPRQRTEKLLAELGRPAAARGNIYGPVGLDIGADSPREIALAILAEIRAVLSGRGGGFLRDRRGPLHEWPS